MGLGRASSLTLVFRRKSNYNSAVKMRELPCKYHRERIDVSGTVKVKRRHSEDSSRQELSWKGLEQRYSPEVAEQRHPKN